MGKSRQPWHRRLFRHTILEALQRQSDGIDLMIVDV